MRTITLLIFILCANASSHGQAVTQVKDKYVQRQHENMVYMRWGDFKPKWYYILMHNNYRKGPDRRTLLQLLPTNAAVGITETKSKAEQENVKTMYEEQSWDALNRASELHYHLHFKKIFDSLNKDINDLKLKAVSLNSALAALQAYEKEQERLNGEIEIIRKGWLEKGDSAEAMKWIENDFRTLKINLVKFVHLQIIGQKYQNIQP